MSDHTVAINNRRATPVAWEQPDVPIIIGKDILELVTTSMYVDPMSIYREYLQNAVDSIEEAQRAGIITESDGCVTIYVDAGARSIKIRDNGVGISYEDFVGRLTAFGASKKRGSTARGFRGVGRLAGLAYCQELIFRSRAQEDDQVNELRWSCRELRLLLRGIDFEGRLGELIHRTVSYRRIPVDGWPERFFEVELLGVVRHRNDQLLHPAAVREYIEEVGPVPFSPDFSFGTKIVEALTRHIHLGNIAVYVNGAPKSLSRPHRDTLEMRPGSTEAATDLECFELPGIDGEIAAVGWVLHHEYTGALPARSPLKGMRVRTGNIQVGGDNLLQELFPESRFNSWAVGEIHVVDQRIIPNGRRDNFEQNVHLLNLLNQVGPIAREISRRCRTNSLRRRWTRDFERCHKQVAAKADILKQGTLSKGDTNRIAGQIEELFVLMDRITTMELLDAATRDALGMSVRNLRRSVSRLLHNGNGSPLSPLAHLSPQKRNAYTQVFGLIYECSPSLGGAKTLVDRIIARLGSEK